MSPVRSVIVALLVGLLGLMVALSPVGGDAEQIGLRWLFHLRGFVAPPEDVVVVTVDRQSGRELRQGTRPEDWSRAVHAGLIDALSAAGARVVVLDIFFDRPKTAQGDRLLADAVRRAGNVVMVQRLDRHEFGDLLHNPVAVIEKAASALAPFPLPKIPDKVSFYWPFYTVVEPQAVEIAAICHAMPFGSDRSAPDPDASGEPRIMNVVEAATLPVAALQLLALRLLGPETLTERLPGNVVSELDVERNSVTGAHELCSLFDELRARFKGRKMESLSVPATGFGAQAVVNAVDRSLGQTGAAYLNFYGPPMTFRTYRYAELVSAHDPLQFRVLDEFRDKFVFIGAGDVSAVDQTDGFTTVYTTRRGLDIAGVEIAATAFANLLEDRSVRPLSPGTRLLWIFLFGAVVGMIGAVVPGAWAPAAIALIAVVYTMAARGQFAAQAAWWPLFTPVAVQMPAALILTQFWKYLRSRAERDRYRGYAQHYLPDYAARALAAGSDPDRDPEAVHGVCMMTDVTGYTTVTESLDPTTLSALQNEYFTLLEQDVQAHQGDVLRVEGDSMSAIWIGGEDQRALRLRACRAALAMMRSVAEFNDRHPDSMFPTRIGLMVGDMVIGNVGGAGRYTYTVTGAVITTASRLESANKVLGTSVLCGEAVVTGLDELVVRRLGRFLFQGRTSPEVTYELIGNQPESPERIDSRARFERALMQFEMGQWTRARRVFEGIARAHQNDGPSRFYTELCGRYAESPPPASDKSVVRLETK